MQSDKFDKINRCIVVILVIITSLISLAKAQTNGSSLQPRINNYATFSGQKNQLNASQNNTGNSFTEVEGTSNIDLLNNTANEIVEKRTRNSRYYIDKSNPSKFIQLFSYGGNLNYLKNGKWFMADQKLKMVGNGLYLASEQQEPVGFDVNAKTAFIETVAGRVNFNQWSLLGLKDGKETIIATSNWSHYTAGDDGLIIYNIFPGIDAEMKVRFGAIKTSFILHENHFSSMEKLIFRDDLAANQKLGKLTYFGNTQDQSQASFLINDKPVIKVNEAIVYTEKDASKNYLYLPYTINSNSLSITLATSYINTHLQLGDVIIDPLVEATATLAQNEITGSMNCGSSSNYCNYNFNVPTPPKATLTNVSFKFGFYANPPSGRNQGHFMITSGTCASGYYGVDDPLLNTGPGSVSTMGNFVNTNPLAKCMPSASCVTQDVPFELRFFNNYCGGSKECSNSYVRADEPLIIKIEGHTLELATITAPQTICNFTSATLVVEPQYGVQPYAYLWSTGDASNSIKVSPNTTTTYTVVVTDNCGNTINASTQVNVDPSPTIQYVNSNAPLCEGEQLVLSTPLVLGATYSWTGPNNFVSSSPNILLNNVTASQSGTYSLKIMVNGCYSLPVNSVVEINRHVLPAVVITASSAVICTGTRVSFQATTFDAGVNPSYQWQKNGTNVGVNSTTYNDQNLIDGDVVTCILTTTVLCTQNPIVKSNSITITINPTLVPAVSIRSSILAFCAGLPATFEAVPVNCGNSPTYNWQINGVATGAKTAIFTSRSLRDGDIVKCIVVCDPTGCYTTSEASSNEVEVKVNQLPQLALVKDTTVFLGASFIIQGTATGNIVSYQWSPSTYLNNSTILNPVVTPLQTITYTVHATNEANCTATEIVTVRVLPKIEVPNTFSPNGDGINDTWVIKGLSEYNGATINIYNRNGQHIFQSNNKKSWDGTVKGKLLPNGTYYYLIDPKNNLPILSGWIIILL